MSFGRTITEARKRANLSQRELAACVIKEDGRPISPKYLNAFERGRRTPTSDRLIEQLAQELGFSGFVVYHRAGGVQKDLQDGEADDETVVEAWTVPVQFPRVASSRITSNLSSVGLTISE